jgi:thiol-disulfide isomerase/thioredoxin
MDFLKNKLGFNNMGSKLNFMTGGSGSSSILYIILAFVVILIIVYLARNWLMPLIPIFKTNYTPNNEYTPSKNASSNEAELIFFYADWCPHCKTAKPVWEEITSEYENKTVNGYKVVFTEVNCTTENAKVEEMMNKYKIEGFPTIKLIKDGQVIEFDAKPTKNNLTQFLNTAL